MKHYGDITKLHGYELPIVDCITGGSPCQDLSVAGKRAGLDGERSGLFMEQIRIIKEMREHDRQCGRTDEFIRPRYMVWENVHGAFSSNKGEDFRIVLEETARVADSNAVIPRLAEGKKWTTAGAILGDGWSIAWRVHDAQFWGVPQRRRRIALVADFGGQSAPEILFERKGMSGDFAESEGARKRIAEGAEEYTGESGEICFSNRELSLGQQTETLRSGCHGALPMITCENNTPVVIEGNGSRDSHKGNGYKESEIMYTLNTIEQHAVCAGLRNKAGSKSGSVGYQREQSSTLLAGQEVSVLCSCFTNSGFGKYEKGCGTLKANGGDLGGGSETLVHRSYQTITGTLSPGQHPGGYNGQDASNDMFITENYVVRRLTPLECERLQGFPNGWTDIGEWVDSKGKKHKGDADSPRYKALGNSIALPFWFWLLRRISAQYERPATLGSLFDGIGGFPLCWERCNGKGTALWASEIEEFPIAVTKYHFKED